MAAGKEEKLTKKQRKALEFKKGAKAADKRAANDEEDGARAEASSVVEAPQAELSRVQKAEEPEVDGDNEEQNQEEEEEEDVQEEGAGKRVAAKGSATRSKEEKRKAKRDAKKLRIKEKKAGGKKAGASNGSEPTKAPGNGSEATGEEDEEEDEETKAKKRDTKSRFIVFVGNMAYTTTSEKLAAHFAPHCSETPTVRLLTTPGDPTLLSSLSKSKQKSIAKGKLPDPSLPRSKGCGFVEFETSAGLQKALQFHHTMLDGRQINVELTAGGGGNSGERKERIKSKNAELGEERKAKFEKFVKPAKENKEEQGGNKRKAADEGAAARGEGQAQWGRRGGAGAGSAPAAKRTKVDKKSNGRGAGRKPWTPTGSNAVTLSG